MSESEKLEAFGRMVFGMMCDVLLVPPSNEAYARKTITMPDGNGGQHALELIVARSGVADVMERAVAERMAVKDIDGSSRGIQ